MISSPAGRGTTVFAHFKLAPLASVLRVSPYAIGGLGRQWYEELGPDLRPVTPNNMTYTICVYGTFPDDG